MVLRIKGGIIKKVQKNASGLLDVLKVETIFLQRQYVTFGVWTSLSNLNSNSLLIVEINMMHITEYMLRFICTQFNVIFNVDEK